MIPGLAPRSPLCARQAPAPMSRLWRHHGRRGGGPPPDLPCHEEEEQKQKKDVVDKEADGVEEAGEEGGAGGR